jgi:hypothetical protein
MAVFRGLLVVVTSKKARMITGRNCTKLTGTGVAAADLRAGLVRSAFPLQGGAAVLSV